MKKAIPSRTLDKRTLKLQRMERVLWNRHLRIAGVDEAGVGPLAGPVVAAAVLFEPGSFIPGVDDSKKLDAEKRSQLAGQIKETAASVAVGCVVVEEIDRINIYHAALLAMRRAVGGLQQKPDVVLTDAREIPDLNIPQRPVIKGDARCFSIAAASIIAKTHRDGLMAQLDDTYPQYGFARHKGYCTKVHRDALREFGACPEHRNSFPVISELIGTCSAYFYGLRADLDSVESHEDLKRFRLSLAANNHRLAPKEKQRLLALASRRRRFFWRAGDE